jgi:hypothetical protein
MSEASFHERLGTLQQVRCRRVHQPDPFIILNVRESGCTKACREVKVHCTYVMSPIAFLLSQHICIKGYLLVFGLSLLHVVESKKNWQGFKERVEPTSMGKRKGTEVCFWL